MENENGHIKSARAPLSKDQYYLKTFQASLNLLAHVLIGIVVGSCLILTFRNGLPIGAVPIHIVLCVLGYQLLMAESILSLCPHNGWSEHLRLVDKKRAHWVLQIVGSALAIAGSVIISIDRDVNFTSLHGKFDRGYLLTCNSGFYYLPQAPAFHIPMCLQQSFCSCFVLLVCGLVAFVFTTVSLVNGVSSLWAYEIRKVVPLSGTLSKVTHICFGIVAFASATISLCYGYDKNMSRRYFGDANTETLIAFSAAFTAIVLINPCITFMARLTGKWN